MKFHIPAIVTLAITAALTFTACDTSVTTGYTDVQKDQIADVVKPVAIQVASDLLKHGMKPKVSDDGKQFLMSWGFSSEYSVYIELAKTSDVPDPTQVQFINLAHWVVDPTNQGAAAEDRTLYIDARHTDHYWYVWYSSAPSPQDKFSSQNNSPDHGSSSFEQTLSTTRDIIKQVSDLEQGVLRLPF